MDEDDDYSDDGPTIKKQRQKRKLEEEEEEEEEENTDEDEDEDDEDSDNAGLFSSEDENEDDREQIDNYDNEDDDDASVHKNVDDASVAMNDEEEIEEEDEHTRTKRLMKSIKETEAAASAAASKKKKKQTKKIPKVVEPKVKRQKKSLPQKNFGVLLAKTKALTNSRDKDVAIAVESLVISKREEEEEKNVLAANNELAEKRAAKQKRMKEQRARAIKGSNCFPRTSIGYNPDISNVFAERERRHTAEGIVRVAAEAIKHLDVTKTRFVPCNTNANDMAFYQKPCTLCCLWCTEPFDNPPFPLPRRVSPIKCDTLTLTDKKMTFMLSDERAVSFHVTGQYCSPSCVLAAADECSRLNGMKSLKPLVFYMLRKAYNMPSKTDIVQAPDRRMLTKYGGIMDINAFRATGAIGIHTSVAEMPLVPFYAGVEEVEKIKFCVRETLDPGGVVDYVVKVVHSIGAQALTTRNAYQQQQHTRETKRPSDFRNNIRDNKVALSSSPNRFSAMPTIAEQLALSERMMVLEKETVGDKTGNVKRKTLKDFMRLESRPRILPKP